MRKGRTRRRPRKSRAQPKTGWTLAELASLAGTTARTVRLYLERELVPRPPFLAAATRYQRRHLVWLVAARRLRVMERLELSQIKTRLHALTAQELEAFATADLQPGQLAQALGVTPVVRAPDDALGASPTAAPIRVSSDRRWTRLELAIGLELHVRDDITPRVRELAKRVWELCIHGDEQVRAADTSSQAAPGEAVASAVPSPAGAPPTGM